jgi:hypothetical protein
MADTVLETTILPESTILPVEVEAFEALAGWRPLPPNIDTESYLRLCQAVLEDAIDRVEMRRNRKPVFWPTPRLESTNSPADGLLNIRGLHFVRDHPSSNSGKRHE